MVDGGGLGQAAVDGGGALGTGYPSQGTRRGSRR